MTFTPIINQQVLDFGLARFRINAIRINDTCTPKSTVATCLTAEFASKTHVFCSTAALTLVKRNQHKREYEEIIKGKKTLNVRSVRFINLGIPRSGKTTFWHRLMKLIIEIDDNKKQQSTGVADEQRPVLIELGSGMVTPDEWHVLDEGEYANKLIQMFSKLVHAKSSTIPQPGNPADTSPANTSTGGQIPTAGSDDLLSDTPVKTDFSSTSTSASIPDMERSFTSLFNKALESGSDWESLKCELEDIILLSSADTGGHAEFLGMHPAHINGPSFNLIFSRLTDELGEPFKVYFTDEDHTSTEEEDSDSTVEEVMFHILSSIVCFGESHSPDESTPEDSVKLTKALKFRQSKVMFVGTFKDQVSDEEFKGRMLNSNNRLKVQLSLRMSCLQTMRRVS